MQRTDANVDTVQTLVHSDWKLGVRLIEEMNMGICSDPNSGLTSEFSTMTKPLHMMC
jgi:hypothetical protein